ncbi:hypothetical protein AAC387_Pa11g2190 [Persea americana]
MCSTSPLSLPISVYKLFHSARDPLGKPSALDEVRFTLLASSSTLVASLWAAGTKSRWVVAGPDRRVQNDSYALRWMACGSSIRGRVETAQ